MSYTRLLALSLTLLVLGAAPLCAQPPTPGAAFAKGIAAGSPLPPTLNQTFSYYLAHGTNSSTADFLRVSVVGATTSVVLQELGSTANDNGAWVTASASLNAFAGQTVRILVEAADASTASLVEAGIDDVKITQQ